MGKRTAASSDIARARLRSVSPIGHTRTRADADTHAQLAALCCSQDVWVDSAHADSAHVSLREFTCVCWHLADVDLGWTQLMSLLLLIPPHMSVVYTVRS